MTSPPPHDAALRLALRALTWQRAALRYDRRARRTESTLAHWARARAIPLSRATRTQHPLAKQLHQHLRAAARARRQRDRLLPALASTVATCGIRRSSATDSKVSSAGHSNLRSATDSDLSSAAPMG